MSNLSKIEEISKRLDLPETAENKASNLFKKAAEENLLRGRSAENILGGAVYTACRMESCPRAFPEIAEVLGVKEKGIYRGYKHILRNLNKNIPPVNPNEYLDHLADMLDLDSNVEEKAGKIIGKANENGLSSGRCPFGMAGAAVYIAGHLEDDKRAQREIKNAAHVSEVTVRSRIHELVKELSGEFEFCEELESSLKTQKANL